jgi:hypothetical protein
MKTLDLREAPAAFTNLVEALNQEPVILLRAGKPLAVLLPVKDADVETVSLSFHPKFLAILEDARRRRHREPGFSTEELCREFGITQLDERKPKAPKKHAKSPRQKANTRSAKPNGAADGRQV